VRVNVQLFAPACVLVANGAGVALVDPISAQIHSARGLVAIPFEPAIPFSVGLITPIGRPPSLLATSFLKSLKEGFAPYLM
jgi:DNA-binding transcriptional LysR family regulator